MNRHPEHKDIIKFLEDNLDNQGTAVPAPGSMITNIGRYCTSQLELIQGTKNERQYKISMLHIKQLKKVLK